MSEFINKSTIKRNIINYSGYAYLKWKLRAFGFYCFNYHRIGDPNKTPFDPNVFSCTKETFANHLQFYQENFEVINIKQLIYLISSEIPLKKHYALITFDDGYKDNYDDALPLLIEQNISATFFIPTDYINNQKVPWWDEIAWMIKQCNLDYIQLPHWQDKVILDKQNFRLTLRKIISQIKKNRQMPIDTVLNIIREKTQVKFCYNEGFQLFMNWDMLKEIQNNGMDIGSHGCSHQILSHLSSSDQIEELKLSKSKLESKLNTAIQAFAYPEGGVNTYNQLTIEALEKTNYKLGFNFIPGINKDLKKAQFELRRLPVSNNCSVSDLKILSTSY